MNIPALLLTVAFGLAVSLPALAAPTSHVAIVTIDGFAASLLGDPKNPLPHLDALVKGGAVAQGMRVSTPAVTWPNHTTLITGVHPDLHSVFYNGVLVRGEPGFPVKVDPKRDQTDLVSVPTLFELLKTKGGRSAAINWPCTRGAVALEDNFPDVPEQLSHTTPLLRAELLAKGLMRDTNDLYFRSLTGPARDEIWTLAACQVVEARKPNLLLFHLLNTDGTHHKYGAGTPASHTALALADSYIGRLLAAYERAGLRDQLTLFIVADHGFSGAKKVLQPNVLLRKAGLLEGGNPFVITKARAQVVPEGGCGMIYLTQPATLEADRRQVIELFKNQEGVAEILTPDRFAALSLPSPEKNRQMADLVLVPKEGYAVTGLAAGEEFALPLSETSNQGYHGYLSTNPKMNALFIAWGRGIKSGQKIGVIDNIDVAPTAAHLLGFPIPGAAGRVLEEILQKP